MLPSPPQAMAADPSPTSREELQLVVPHQGVEQVSVRIDRPAGGADPDACFVLAHGAGAPMDHEFMEAIAPRLAAASGAAVMRFNYAYAELMGRTGSPRPPERRPALEVVHRAALGHARSLPGVQRIIAGGKSMGGRIASMMAAEGEPVDGLCFLGYPLHPAGKPDRLRTEHFPSIDCPTLFLQGTRDALCDLELLRPAMGALPGPATLHEVEGADHGFQVLRRSGRTRGEVLDDVAEAFGRWARGLSG